MGLERQQLFTDPNQETNAMRSVTLRHAILIVSLIASTSVARSAQSDSSRIVREVGDAHLAAVTRDDLQRQLKLGLPVNELPDYSFAAAERRSKEAAEWLSKLARVRPGGLAHEETLSVDVLTHQLQTRIDATHSFYFAPQVTPYASPIGPMAQAFAVMPLSTAGDRARYLARLHDMKKLVATLATNVAAQARRGIRIPKPELALVEGFLKSLAVTGEASPFRPAAARLATMSTTGRATFLQNVDTEIQTAIASPIGGLARSLRGDYAASAPEAVGLSQYPGGLEFYRSLVKSYTTMDVTPEDVHAIGLANVAKINAEMAKIREELKFTGTQAEFKASLRSNPKLFPNTPEEIGDSLMS